MKTLIPLIIAICLSSVAGQTSKPLTPREQSIEILKAEVERLERKVAEMKKVDEALLEQERAARKTGSSLQGSTINEPHYPSTQHYPRYYPRYSRLPTYYPRRYYPRSYYSRYYSRYYPRYYVPRFSRSYRR